MSRTFRRDESGHKPRDARRAKRREKSNSHWKTETNDYEYTASTPKFNRTYKYDYDVDN